MQKHKEFKNNSSEKLWWCKSFKYHFILCPVGVERASYTMKQEVPHSDHKTPRSTSRHILITESHTTHPDKHFPRITARGNVKASGKYQPASFSFICLSDAFSNTLWETDKIQTSLVLPVRRCFTCKQQQVLASASYAQVTSLDCC